jgi:hypothetical protein
MTAFVTLSDRDPSASNIPRKAKAGSHPAPVNTVPTVGFSSYSLLDGRSYFHEVIPPYKDRWVTIRLKIGGGQVNVFIADEFKRTLPFPLQDYQFLIDSFPAGDGSTHETDIRRIEVTKSTQVPTNTVAESSAPTQESDGFPPIGNALCQGTLQIPQTYTVGLDGCRLETPGDIWFEAKSDTDKLVAPVNNALIGKVRSTSPEVGNCKSAELTSRGIPLAELSIGDSLCVRTNQGRFSLIEITRMPPPSTSSYLGIRYVTWK